MASSLGALIGPLFESKTPPSEDKERAAKPTAKTNKKRGTATFQTTKAKTTEPAQQHGELASAAEPAPLTDTERVRQHARNEKVRATQDWVEGRITSKEHEAVHKRADHVLMNRKPKVFKGTVGEKKVKWGAMR